MKRIFSKIWEWFIDIEIIVDIRLWIARIRWKRKHGIPILHPAFEGMIIGTFLGCIVVSIMVAIYRYCFQ